MKNYETMTDKEKLNYLITRNHTGKMDGMVSLSTSVLLNENCKRNQTVKGSICSHCYACAQLKFYKTQAEKLKKATEFLTSHIIALNDIPQLNVSLFRFEAFGDLNNSIQVVNYFNIAKMNPEVKFGLWTKNPFIISYALKEYNIEKPENLVIILSSMFLNKQYNYDRMKEVYPFIDKVFTVYDENYIEENNITINCGAKNCFTCKVCYDKNNGITDIKEKLK